VIVGGGDEGNGSGLTPPSCSAPPPEKRACAAAELGADHYPPEAAVLTGNTNSRLRVTVCSRVFVSSHGSMHVYN
jgi:hypothetical protein